MSPDEEYQFHNTMLEPSLLEHGLLLKHGLEEWKGKGGAEEVLSLLTNGIRMMRTKCWRGERITALYSNAATSTLYWLAQKKDKKRCERLLFLMSEDIDPHGKPLFDMRMLRAMIKNMYGL